MITYIKTLRGFYRLRLPRPVDFNLKTYRLHLCLDRHHDGIVPSSNIQTNGDIDACDYVLSIIWWELFVV
jgi:hypothetical protein